MTLHLQLVGEYETDPAFERVAKALHRKFDGWSERVDVTLTHSPSGWVIVRATATIPSAVGPGTAETSRLVAQEVRSVLEEAREPVV